MSASTTAQRTIGRYEVEDEVGRGAMGVVYRARDPLIGRTVALKVLADTSARPEDQQRELRARFLREARAAGGLQHPNIVAVYDVGIHEGVPFIAQELVEGRSLAAMIAAHGALAVSEAVRIVCQVADALAYAHARGIVHRDVKPDNILIGKDGRAFLTDFGIARLGPSELTHSGELLGTPWYMSPEQIQGAALDGRSDLFSLGVVLYHALTGVRPFDGESVTAICYQIVHAPARPFPSDPGVPPRIAALIEALLRKRPEERPASGIEVVQALEPASVRTLSGPNSWTGAGLAPGPAPGPAPTLISMAESSSGQRQGRTAAFVATLVGLGLIGMIAVALRPAHDAGPLAAQVEPVAAPEDDGLAPGTSTADEDAAGARATLPRAAAIDAPAAQAGTDAAQFGAPAAQAGTDAAQFGAPAARTVDVGLVVFHPLPGAHLSLSIDGEPVLQQDLKGRRRWPNTSARAQGRVEMPAGRHTVHALLESPDVGFRAEGVALIDVTPGAQAVLRIVPRRTRPPSLDVRLAAERGARTSPDEGPAGR